MMDYLKRISMTPLITTTNTSINFFVHAVSTNQLILVNKMKQQVMMHVSQLEMLDKDGRLHFLHGHWGHAESTI